MSKGKILVTDSLFVFDEHVKQLESAGYEVERLDKTRPTNDELKAALQDKIGYVLGGIEAVNEHVLDSAPLLKAIALPAIGYQSSCRPGSMPLIRALKLPIRQTVLPAK